MPHRLKDILVELSVVITPDVRPKQKPLITVVHIGCDVACELAALTEQIVDPNDQQAVFADPCRQDVIQLSTA